MADTPQIDLSLPTVLPILRERAVYVKDDGNGVDNSDFINKSFKGILRLSPNDSASYIEQENYISYDESIADYITFEDDITHQLENQFIKVSTSDGYLLDLRLSKYGVEYDNLYVLGATEITSPLQLFVTDKRSFKLGNSYIVSDRNKQSLNTERAVRDCVPINDETLDDTFVLVNTNNEGMEFVNAKNLIELFIREALMEINSVPTGSIHFMPVNITQYSALLKKSCAAGGGHNITVSDNDPLIRDYLLCDGSYYRSTDFPELAKILNKENISYWKVAKNNNSDAYRLELQKEVNDGTEIIIYKGVLKDENIEAEEELTRVFRVPDLRGMFIQSALTGPTTPNTVGDYERDCIKDNALMVKHGADKHYHYIVLDNPIPSKNTTSGDLVKIIDVDENGKEHLAKNCNPTALARYGAIGSNKETFWYGKIDKTAGTGNKKVLFKGGGETAPNGCGQCCKSCRGSYGASPIYKPSFLSYNCFAGGPSGGYILSTLNRPMNAEITRSDWIGASSWGIDMSLSIEEVEKLDNIDNILNYTTAANDAIYNGKPKKYVSYNNEDMKTLLGYENTPEFYGVLPLIKI